MLISVLKDGKRAIDIDEDESIIEGLPAKRQNAPSAYVSIIYGCNEFLLYCRSLSEAVSAAETARK